MHRMRRIVTTTDNFTINTDVHRQIVQLWWQLDMQRRSEKVIWKMQLIHCSTPFFIATYGWSCHVSAASELLVRTVIQQITIVAPRNGLVHTLRMSSGFRANDYYSVRVWLLECQVAVSRMVPITSHQVNWHIYIAYTLGAVYLPCWDLCPWQGSYFFGPCDLFFKVVSAYY